ncbi:hypothetical protein [Vibrio sp. M260112]|uniref:hypothetical protein n=1 Tax=Vibrio sp. M260112 TaxID=3020895 RepID=UPI002F41D826
MFNELQRSFTTPHSFRALEREVEMAEALIEHDGTAFPDASFEEGYIAALRFVLNRQGSNVREEFEDLMDELNSKGEAA